MATYSDKDLDWLFKASWGGTALKFWITAPTEALARKRAERYVLRMEGRYTIVDLDLLGSR